MKRFDVAVIIPTLNEEESIGWVIEEIKRNLQNMNYVVVVVDGGSTDKTVEVAKLKGAEVILQDDKGYGDAYIKGFDHVLSKYKPKIIVMIDGDGTYDPNDLESLLEPILNGKADVVVGNRFLRMEKDAMNFTNKFGNRVLSRLTRIMTGLKVEDAQSGYRALKSEVTKILPLKEKGMPFAVELLVKAYSHGFQIVEVPVAYRRRIGGRSKLNPFRDGFKILNSIFKLALTYNPVFFTFFLGALLLIPGLLLATYTGYQYLVYGVKNHAMETTSFLLILSGFQSLLLAILAIYMKRMELRLLRYIRHRSEE